MLLREELLNKEDIIQRFPIVGNFIRANNLEEIEDTQYYLENGIYVNIESYLTKAYDESRYESHRKYVDLQYLISGVERILVLDASKCNPLTEYDDKKDIIFYSKEEGKEYILRKGQGVILYPTNAHMPCLEAGDIEFVKKAVFKIPVHLMIRKVHTKNWLMSSL